MREKTLFLPLASFSWNFYLFQGCEKMETVIKYFTIALCAGYIFKKLLGIDIRKIDATLDIFGAISTALFLHVIDAHEVGIIIVVLLYCVGNGLLYNLKISVSFVGGIISFGLAYLGSLITSVLVLPISFIFALFAIPVETIATINTISISLLQQATTYLLFRVSRLEKGMPFLQNAKAGWFGMALGLTILFATSFILAHHKENALIPFYIVIIAESGFVLILWWRQKILDRYNERIHRKQLEDARTEAEQIAAERESLKRDNQELAKLIHTDSKMVSAVGASAAELLQEAEFRDNFKKQRANDLISFIETYNRERSAALFDYNNHVKQLPQTGLAGVDAMIAQMQRAAFLEGIDFDFNFTGTIKAFVPAAVNEVDLAKLIGDLAQNAINATRDYKTKRIIVFFSAAELFKIDILDSGDLFPVEVIAKLGCEQITTHANSGGSGYGMVTVFEICRKYGASFVLEETPEKVFSKKVAICFDGLMQFRIHTSREEVLATKSIRQDVIWT